MSFYGPITFKSKFQTGIAFDICFDNETKLTIVFKCTYCLYLQIVSSLKFEVFRNYFKISLSISSNYCHGARSRKIVTVNLDV